MMISTVYSCTAHLTDKMVEFQWFWLDQISDSNLVCFKVLVDGKVYCVHEGKGQKKNQAMPG